MQGMLEDQPLRGSVQIGIEIAEWRPPRFGRSIDEVSQDDEPQPIKQGEQDRSFDSVKIKYLNFDNVKSVILTKLRV